MSEETKQAIGRHGVCGKSVYEVALVEPSVVRCNQCGPVPSDECEFFAVLMQPDEQPPEVGAEAERVWVWFCVNEPTPHADQVSAVAEEEFDAYKCSCGSELERHEFVLARHLAEERKRRLEAEGRVEGLERATLNEAQARSETEATYGADEDPHRHWSSDFWCADHGPLRPVQFDDGRWFAKCPFCPRQVPLATDHPSPDSSTHTIGDSDGSDHHGITERGGSGDVPDPRPLRREDPGDGRELHGPDDGTGDEPDCPAGTGFSHVAPASPDSSERADHKVGPDCEKAIEAAHGAGPGSPRSSWMKSGHRDEGESEACPVCGALWVCVIDEAEGLYWVRGESDPAPATPDLQRLREVEAERDKALQAAFKVRNAAELLTRAEEREAELEAALEWALARVRLRTETRTVGLRCERRERVPHEEYAALEKARSALDSQEGDRG